MNEGFIKVIAPFAAQTGLLIDNASGVMFGNYGGYDITVSPIFDNRTFRISCFVKHGGAAPQLDEIKRLAKANKSYFGLCTVTGYRVDFNLRQWGLSLKTTVKKSLNAALEIITMELKNGGYENCCQLCGSTEENGTYYINDGAVYLCERCYQAYTVSADNAHRAHEAKTENIVGGTVGALLGSLIGAAAIILISQLGYVAAISGVIMGVCALKGYELLGGKLSKKGIIISCVIMILTVFLSYQLDSAIYLAAEYTEYSVFECFNIFNNALFTGGIIWSSYLPQLIMLYLFTALGAVPTIAGSIKKQKVLNIIYRMDTPKERAEVSDE